MDEENLESRQLREVALRNARSIQLEKERVERELLEERERLRITLSSIGDGVISTDAIGRVVFLNRVAEELTGWPQADAAGRPLPEVFQIIDEATRQPVENPALRAVREGRVIEFANHTVLIARDKTERLVDDSASPMRDEAGAAIGAVLVFRDVTERRRTEEVRAQLAAIVESSEDAIISKTLDGIIRSWNAGAERLFGYTRQEAVGQPITLIIPPDRIDEQRAIVERLRRGERIEHFETIRVRKDGQRLEISLTVSPLKNRDGQVIGASKIARDLTVRKRAEARVALAFQAARLGDWSWNAATDRVTLSARAAEIYGLASDSIESTRLQELIHEEDRDRARQEYERAVASGDSYDLEVRINRPDGKQVWISASGLAQFHPNRSVIGTLGVIQDITEKKRLEQELRTRVEELAEADRKKDDFIALLAHELRNPLAPIRTGLQVMRLAAGDANAVAKARNMMDRQLTHMVRLIDDLLDVSRMSRNKLHLQKTRVLLAEVVSHALEAVGPAVQAAGHVLTVSIPPQPIVLDADLTRLVQVLGNLLTNSAKYTERGGRIWLTAELRDGWAVISVRDSGIGIPSPDLPRVFEMFSQVDRTVERASGGLGIGLALVKGLVERHGGTVTVESPGPGRGSTFTIRLPMAESRAEPSPIDASSEARPVRPARKIIVVDDNKDGAASLADLLELLGNEVHVAYDGVEAFEVAERIHPDLMLMDIGMPRQNGLEATKQIREQPWGRDITIIALSGWGQEGDRERSRAAGCNGHLVKPVNIPQMESLLAELSAGKKHQLPDEDSATIQTH